MVDTIKCPVLEVGPHIGRTFFLRGGVYIKTDLLSSCLCTARLDAEVGLITQQGCAEMLLPLSPNEFTQTCTFHQTILSGRILVINYRLFCELVY
jgi:hypothetical protein